MEFSKELTQKEQNDSQNYQSQVSPYWASNHEKLYPLYFMNLYQMMNLQNAKNILESLFSIKQSQQNAFLVGCNDGIHFKFLLKLKNKQTQYTAQDNDHVKLGQAKWRIEQYEKFPLSKIESQQIKGTFENKEEYFESFNLFLKFGDNENFPPKYNNSFDTFFICISNLDLQNSNQPEKMLEALYDCLNEKGKLGLTIFGRLQNSKYFTFIPEIFAKHDIKLPPLKQHFAIQNKEELIKLLESVKFKNIIAWYQEFAIPDLKNTVNDFLKGVIAFQKLLEGYNEEKIKEIKQEIFEVIETLQEKKEVMQVEILFAIAEK